MKRLLITLFFAPCILSAWSQAPFGYYNAAENLEGTPLASALHAIIDDHNVLTYADLWDAFEETDAHPNGSVWDIYSMSTSGMAPYYYSFGSDQCGNYNSEGDCYNREHTVPSSWFNDASPMRTDLFHIYPTDGYVNNQRGNLPYGEVNSAQWQALGGAKRGNSATPGYTQTVFEPTDEYKGDLARTYFYMAIRYRDVLNSWQSEVFSGNSFEPWALNLFLAWHEQDPVSAREQERNNAIFNLQGNRNPFIDNPHYAPLIWVPGFVSTHQPETDICLVQRGCSVLWSCSGSQSSQTTIELYDLAGKRVANWSLDATGTEFTVNGYTGAYLLRYSTAKREEAKLIWLNCR